MHALRRTAFCLLIGLCLLVSGRSRAGGTAALIDSATSDFVALNFEKALKKLKQALQNPGNRPGELVRIYGLRALCCLSLSQEAEAGRAFTAALSIDPAFRLGPEVSPRFSRPFRRILERGVRALRVELEVPAEVSAGRPVKIGLRLAADPANLSDSLIFYHRRSGAESYSPRKVRLIRGKQHGLEIPVGRQGVLEWYHQVLDRHGGVLRTGDPEKPGRIRVKPKLDPLAVASDPVPAAASAPAWYQRWWVWAIIGGVAAAAGTTAIVLAGSEGEAASHRDFSIQIR